MRENPVPRQSEVSGSLRPEARPIPFERMDAQQQGGVRRIISLLTSAAQAVPTERSPHVSDLMVARSQPFIDSSRSSGTILVSGERGTGKTTLLLSLAELSRPPAAPIRHQL